MRSINVIAAACGVWFVCGAALAGSVSIEPVKDNTLYEHPEGILSNGGGAGIFVGRTNQFDLAIRRALVAFDVAGAVPSGATITSVTLTLVMNQTIVGPHAVTVHRVLADWGEGEEEAAGGEGGGANPDEGSVTWIHTFFPDQFWASEGGDFDAAEHATTIVSGPGSYTWGSTAEMVADVQAWLDEPASNFGWLLQGNEAEAPTAKRFASREASVSQRPCLTIEFEEAAPCDGDVDDSGAVDVDDLVAVILAWGDCPDGPPCPADLDGSGVVDVDDLVAVILGWGPC